MMIVVLLLLAMADGQIPGTSYSADFQKFINTFGKRYETPDEGRFREIVRNQNMLSIQKHNQDKNYKWQEGETQFVDLTTQEFEARILMKPIFLKEFIMPGSKPVQARAASGAAASSVDWV